MTDNRTIELLRKGLTERGIEWKNIGGATSGDGITEWLVDGMTCRAAQRVTVGIEHLALYIPVLTPEQAIAATLGSEREAKLIRAMEDVLRHATDTVWVSEIETLVDRMVSLGVYGCEVYEGAIAAWNTRETRHVKPRTLEDVLRDVWKEALDYAKSDMWRNPDEVFAERADEIRELMKEEA